MSEETATHLIKWNPFILISGMKMCHLKSHHYLLPSTRWFWFPSENLQGLWPFFDANPWKTYTNLCHLCQVLDIRTAECHVRERRVKPFSPPGIALEIRKELTFSTGSVINSHEPYHKSQSKLSDSIWIFLKRFFDLTCLFLPKSAPPLVLPISVTQIWLHVGWWEWLKKKDGEQSQTPRSSCLVLVTLKNTVTYDK